MTYEFERDSNGIEMESKENWEGSERDLKEIQGEEDKGFFSNPC
jgi:hypothetical protein